MLIRRLAPLLLLATLSLVHTSSPSALPAPATADDDPAQALSPTYLRSPLPLSDALKSALRGRRHSEAAKLLKAMDTSTLSGDTVGDHAFLLAWSLVRSNKAKEGVHLQELVAKAEHAPPAYRDLTRAELLVADGEHVQAAEVLANIPETARIHPRALLVRAKALRDAGNTADARAAYQALAARPDPAEGTELALIALAELSGSGSPEAYTYLRRAWAVYPFSDSGRSAGKKLSAYNKSATWQDLSWRGDRVMVSGNFKGTVNLLAPHKGKVKEASADACRFWYAYGRSLFRLNEVTKAAAVLAPMGKACVEFDPDRGAKALYLAGKANERKKAWAAAAQEYARISELYPEHSYADDGLALAGIATQEAGDLVAAQALWERQVATYPTGDLAGEGFWRLAWGAYLSGDTPAAIQWAEKASWSVPIQVDPEHVRAAMYWAARWRAYPDVNAPTVLTTDTAARDEAIRLWLELCRNHPYSYYAMISAGRLQELAPEALAAVPRPVAGSPDAAWVVREAWINDPAASAGVQLARLGLYKEAMAEFDAIDRDQLTPAEFAVATTVMWDNGQWLIAHDKLKLYLEHMPPELLGSQRQRILFHAYPNKYWDEVHQTAKDYRYDPRMFHALVREESNFNRKIVSHAGARGLSQLMPATARGVAGWLGIKVSNDQLFDPATNLRLGSRYMESLVKRYHGNPFLSMAGYNAGEGNVGKWVALGDRPTDEFVEAIPFRETRRYVKRVSRTWQTYHLLYDAGPTYPELKAFNHSAVP